MKKKPGSRIKAPGALVFITNKLPSALITRLDKVWEKPPVTRLCRPDERAH